MQGDKLIGAMRFLNGVVLILLALNAFRGAAYPATAVSGIPSLVGGALLCAAPFLLAWRGLARTVSADTTNAAWIVNLAAALLMLVVLGVAAFAAKHFSLGLLIPLAGALVLGANIKALSTKKAGQVAPSARVDPTRKRESDGGIASFGPLANPDGLVDAAPNHARSNYFLRHWRGELPLPRSYWVNGTLLGMASSGIVAVIGALQEHSASLRLIAVTSLLALCGSVAFSIWSIVGIWRSAGRHAARGGSAGWAVAARVVTVFAVVGVATNLMNSVLPQMHEFALIAVGRDPIGRFRVSVSPDGRAIRVVGTLREGAASAIVGVIDATPTAKWLILDSNGGRVVEAEELARAVRGHRLDTYVDRICVSACTYVFLAGGTRAASLEARIGFHQPSFVGLNALGRQRATQAMLDVYRADGLPDDFIRHIGETPPSSMWYPTRDELLGANVVTRIMHSPVG